MDRNISEAATKYENSELLSVMVYFTIGATKINYVLIFLQNFNILGKLCCLCIVSKMYKKAAEILKAIKEFSTANIAPFLSCCPLYFNLDSAPVLEL